MRVQALSGGRFGAAVLLAAGVSALVFLVSGGCMRPSPASAPASALAVETGGAAVAVPAAAAPEASEWMELFDGTSLTGWRASENPTTWRVEDGALVCRGPRSHLFYVGDGAVEAFRDFELEVEVMTEPKSNSGVYFHTEYQETGWPGKGIESQVNNSFPADPRRTASIYGLADLHEPVAEDGRWWTMRIRVRGPQVTVDVDGRRVNEYREPEDASPKRFGSGTFALQGHDPGSVVHYRRVRVRRLPLVVGEPVGPTEPVSVPVAASPTPGADRVSVLSAMAFDGDRAAGIAFEDSLQGADGAALAAAEAELVALLQSGAATYAARDFACRMLRRIGTEASIPVLAGMLADGEMAHMARYALERPGDAAVAAALRQALPALTGKERLGVIASLGILRDAGSVGVLVPFLDSPEALTAAAAATATGRIGGPRAEAALAEVLGRSGEDRRGPLFDGLLRAAEAARTDGRADDALRLYERLYGSEAPAAIRTAALDGIVRTRGAAAVPMLVEILGGGDAELQKAAVFYVRDLPGDGVTAAFASRLGGLAPAAQRALVEALALRGDTAAAPAMLRALARDDAEVRLAALGALKVLGGAAEVVPLARFASQARGSQKDAAREALAGLRGDGIDGALLAALEEPEAGVREAALQALAQRRSVAAADEALRLAGTDAVPAVRLAAIEAIPATGTDASLPRVVRLLAAARSERETDALRQAITGLAQSSANVDAVRTAVASAAAAATEPRIRAALLRVLGRLGGDLSLWAVEGALDDGSPQVSDAAVRALCDWPDEGALGLLCEQAREAEDQVHRVLCIRAAVGLLARRGVRPEVATLDRYGELLRVSERADERRLVLSGLAGTALPEAVALVRPHLKGADTVEEAAIAMARLAKGIVAIDRELAAGTAAAAASVAATEAVRREVQEAVDLIEAMGDTVMNWHVAGPYTDDGVNREQLLHVPFPPEREDSGTTAVDWKPMPIGQDPGKPWLLDLKAAIGGESRAAYLHTYVHSPVDAAARLELGSDDNIKVWLNGRRVHCNPAWRGVKPGEDVVPVTLFRGWNRLLIKVVQGGGDWGAAVRLVGADGSRLAGLQVRPELTAEQRAECVGVAPAEAVLSWSMDEAEGAQVADGSGRGVTGEMRGEPVRAAGVRGGCLVFDGVDDEVRADAGHLPIEPGVPWSMNVFVRPERAMEDLTIVGGFGDVTSARPVGCQRYLVQIRNCVHFWGSNVDVSGGQPFTAGVWQMLTITYDGAAVRIYRNGELLVTQDESLALAASAVRLAPIDHWGKGNRFAGAIDEFTVWNGTLTPEQIRELARALGEPSPESR
ncbi:MAG: DUF1080 domain-containing protein [Lentisphaeria bacterium]|nr:DUF1080 domain-containing protein [Lentisphaeria bacterium]